MLTHIYLRENGQTNLLCTVNLEVVPGGTYVIDGVPYTLVEKPTFVIGEEKEFKDKLRKLLFVNLIVEPIPSPNGG